MAMTHVVGQTINSTAAHFATDGISAPLSMPNPAAAGNLIAVVVTVPDGNIPATSVSTIVDDDGSYTLARRQTTNGSGAAVEIWYRIITGVTGGGQNLVVTVAGPFSVAFTFIGALEFDGALADQSGLTANGATTITVTSHPSGSVTPATANNALVAITTGGNRTYTGDANWTDVEINTRVTFEYRIQSAATAQQHTITSDGNTLVEHAIVAFSGEDEGGEPVVDELDAQPGGFSVTGSAAGTVAGRALDSQPGAYTVTGSESGLETTALIDAQPGAATVTGLAATLALALPFDSQPGSFAVTGSAAGLAALWPLDGQPGTYTVTGAAAGLAWQAALNAVPGVFTVTGAAAELEDEQPTAHQFDAQPGVFAVTGAVGGLTYQTAIDGAPGSFTVTGQVSGLSAGWAVDAAAGSFTVTGSAANLPRALVLDGQPGVYVVTGIAAGLPASTDVSVLSAIEMTGSYIRTIAASGQYARTSEQAGAYQRTISVTGEVE